MYATLSDLQKLVSDDELIQLSDDNGLAINQVNINQAIDRADDRIDGYLANLTSVPVNPVPRLVVQYSAKLAITELYFRRSSAVLPESLVRERSDILKYLDSLAKGRAKLPGLVLPAGGNRAGGARAVARPVASYPVSRLGEF